MQHFIEAQHAAEVAVAGMALRAVFARARGESPEVVSLAITVQADAIPGLDVIECEARDARGMAVGGWSL